MNCCTWVLTRRNRSLFAWPFDCCSLGVTLNDIIGVVSKLNDGLVEGTTEGTCVPERLGACVGAGVCVTGRAEGAKA